MLKMPTLRNTLAMSLSIAVLLALSGCAHMFSPGFQKVSITNTTKGAKIVYPTEGVKGTGTDTKFQKMRIFHTITVEKDGYHPLNYSFQVTKRSPFLALMVLDLALPIYGWLWGIPVDLRSPKTRKFTKQTVPALVSYDIRKSDEKYMIVDNTAIDTKGEHFTWHQYLSLTRYRAHRTNDSRSARQLNRSDKKDDIKVDNTIFTSALNKTMKKMNFVDTTKTIFPAVSNTIYLNSTVKKMTIHNVQSRLSRRATSASLTTIPNELLAIELEIEWEVLDFYKQKLYTTTTKATSDLFTYNRFTKEYDFSNFITSAIENNLDLSLVKVKKELSDKGYLKISGKEEKGLAAISIPRPARVENSRMNDHMRSGVIIKVDEGHGSGVVISADGYIMTAYHVVAGSKKIEVVFQDGTTDSAEVIRKHEASDLALIRVHKKDLAALQISDVADPEIGADVWAIGTPKTVELGQSVSKGVLSALRKANDISYLQTDVSLNSGNSGGPLITKDGVILGIVTSKLIGIGTEGVGFAISAKEIFEKLKVQYL